MSLKFHYSTNENIGKLSWGMTVASNNEKIDVIVGEMVETTEKFFVSGVWDGDFTDGEFEKAEFFCGCGSKIVGNRIIVSTATHERQRICFMKKDDALFISNSIPFLLALANEKLDINCNCYEAILCSIIEGLSDYKKDIPLEGGKIMSQLFSADLIIDINLNITSQRKDTHRDFIDFNDYYESMKKVCERILKNGKDINRCYKLDMIATTSSGYDSSSCAAVVYQTGCKLACTFKDGKFDEDSGADIARQIGYKNIIESSCYEYKKRRGNLDAIFFSDGDLGFFMPFDGFRDVFKEKMVVTGISGGYMWNRNSRVNTDSKRSGYYFYLANISYIEHSLQCGYVMIPLVLYASSAAKSVVRISNSSEMESWTMYDNYDRPIPRRILETSGVKRGTFATANRGAGISFSRNICKKQIKEKMTIEGYDSFIKWLKTKGHNRWDLKRIWSLMQYHISTFPEYMDLGFSRIKLHTSFSSKHENHVPNPGLPSKMIIWAIEDVSSKYATVIRSNR